MLPKYYHNVFEKINVPKVIYILRYTHTNQTKTVVSKMPSVQKLHLEDCLEDTPQAKAMLDLFESDALLLKKFTKAFASSCQKISNAQAMMISATQELSYYLRLYGKQDFPLESSISDETPKSQVSSNTASAKEDLNASGNEASKELALASTLNQFANYVDEVINQFSTSLRDI